MSDFETERADARELLADESVTAFHVGVVRGDQVETASARLAEADRTENLQALSLLAAHLRLVADDAGADYDEAAADAAAIAGRLGGRALSDPGDEDDADDADDA
jgi:hypothetical protein